MLKKIGVLAALTLIGAALLIPDATFARGGGFGGFQGGMRAPFFSPHAVIRRAPFIARTTGHPALARVPSTRPPPVATHLPVRTHVAAPFSHLVQRHHHRHRFSNAWNYPFTTWDDGSYIGIPYDPGATIPVYAPGPLVVDPTIDPPAAPPMPRLSSAREEGQDACRSERVTVPAGDGEREITVVRC
jgi:hypothetical protein